MERPNGKCEGEAQWTITRSARSGYVSSTVSGGLQGGTRCATEPSPMRISAWPGQRLNITVIDFSHGQRGARPASPPHGSAARPALGPHDKAARPPGPASQGHGARVPAGHGETASAPADRGPGGPGGPGVDREAGSERGPGSERGSGSERGPGSEPECNQFAMLYDPEIRRKVKVCPGLNRVRNVYVSTNRSIELYFKRVGSGGAEEQRLLVQFTGSSSSRGSSLTYTQ